MCGIGGIWTKATVTAPVRMARLFGDALAHRGPDGEAFLTIPAGGGAPRFCRTRAEVREDEALRALLVHRRLSIIDLTTGDQPMGLADGSAWIVYNGEVYNYPELKRELAALEPEPFRTTSDTEVILRVYRRWGVEGFRRLNGMFAFALCDIRRGELVLARDPVGIKPLYWAAGPEGMSFASEIRPLLDSGLAAREIAPDGLAQFLFYRFVPAPATVWRGVRKVLPGHAVRFNREGLYAGEVDFAAPAPVPAGQAMNRNGRGDLAEQFQAAVRRQLLSDVPVGAYLSGGLDSSVMVAALGEQAADFPTFAVGFPGSPQDESELDIAERAAAFLGSRHESQTLDLSTYLERLPWAVAHVEEPLAHPGMLLQADLAALARRQVKVVLTGQGADEPFGGYPRHQAARVLPLVAAVLGGVARSGWAERWVRDRERLARIRRVLAAPAGVERTAALYSPMRPEDAGALVASCGADAGRQVILSAIGRWWNRAAGMDDVARVLYVDVRTSLAEDLLLVGDKMSMAHSLEARVPYLDLEYLASLEALPGTARVRLWGNRKRFQQQVGRRLLPPRLARALAGSSSPWRAKRGFDVPVTELFQKTMGGRLSEFVSGRESMLPAYVERRAVQAAVAAHLRSPAQGFRQALAFFILEIWLRVHIGQVAPESVRLA